MLPKKRDRQQPQQLSQHRSEFHFLLQCLVKSTDFNVPRPEDSPVHIHTHRCIYIYIKYLRHLTSQNLCKLFSIHCVITIVNLKTQLTTSFTEKQCILYDTRAVLCPFYLCVPYSNSLLDECIKQK